MRLRTVVFLVCTCGVGLGCEREQRRLEGVAPPTASRDVQTSSPLDPAGAAPLATRPVKHYYEHNAYSMSQGKRLYTWFNCTGCHAQGGGGIGPALMDRTWRYGSDLASIAASIAEGRPNGMPAFGGKLTHDQLMQLAAYVRSLAGLVPMAAAPGRSDSMNVKDPEAMMPGQLQYVELHP
jgi:cytochrome c oxidase cbb3-type subunit III